MNDEIQDSGTSPEPPGAVQVFPAPGGFNNGGFPRRTQHCGGGTSNVWKAFLKWERDRMAWGVEGLREAVEEAKSKPVAGPREDVGGMFSSIKPVPYRARRRVA